MRDTSCLMVAGALAIGAVAVAGAAEVSRTFGSNMVLQSGRTIPVWGTGASGERVFVTFAGASGATTVDAKGAWQVTLPAQKPCAQGRELKVSASSGDQILTGVRVGDVYFVLGDRYVGCPFWCVGSEIKTDLDRYADTNLCWYIYPIARAVSYPLSNLEPQTENYGFWRSCREKAELSSFAYFWARERAEATKMPVGVIICSGGPYDRCDARKYMSPEAYAATKNDKDKNRPDQYDRTMNPTSANGLATHQKAADEIRKWADDAQALPAGMYPATNMAALPNLERFGNVTTLFNSTMAPFAKTPVRGAVFYAGYGWGYDAAEIPLAEELKADMRRIWGQELEFTRVPVPEKVEMCDDFPVPCTKPLEIIRALER